MQEKPAAAYGERLNEIPLDLRRRIRDRGHTVNSLARAAGVEKKKTYRVLRREYEATFSEAWQIAKELQMSMERLYELLYERDYTEKSVSRPLQKKVTDGKVFATGSVKFRILANCA